MKFLLQAPGKSNTKDITYLQKNLRKQNGVPEDDNYPIY